MSIASLRRSHSNAEALTANWPAAWGSPSPFFRGALSELRGQVEALAEGVAFADESAALSALVHPADNLTAPVHRWFAYKEAFSWRLPGAVVSRLGTAKSRVVADVFGGVGTTALALQADPRVAAVLSVEYSPFAAFVADVKGRWAEIDPDTAASELSKVSNYTPTEMPAAPVLTSFHREAVFKPDVLRSLLRIRAGIDRLEDTATRRFFLLALAAVLEHLSGTIKDGRALRIANGRPKRRGTVLRPTAPLSGSDDPVQDAFAGQVQAMVEDIALLRAQTPNRPIASASTYRGDARDLTAITTSTGEPAFADESVGLFVSSPPYLNCLDYSEVYKLELWMLRFVETAEEFRNLRLGTLRSHPSIDFPRRPEDQAADHPSGQVIEQLAAFLERHHARPAIGRMLRGYFADMRQVLYEQLRALEPGGHAVFVVGNSTFSRRREVYGRRTEDWRLPILTDVLLAHMGLEVGFDDAAVWLARELRPRNVAAGAARESLVVLRKPA